MSATDSPNDSRSTSTSASSSNSPSPRIVPQDRPSQIQARLQRVQNYNGTPQMRSQLPNTHSRRHEEQTLPEFLQDTSSQSLEGGSESRKADSSSIDRKRRLTRSTYDEGRRRTTFGGPRSMNISEPSNATLESTTSLPSTSRRLETDQNMSSSVIDLTGTPSPQRHSSIRSQRLNRTRTSSSNSSRRYVVPPWQPDSEVSECPICHRQFSWLFRRHHCRKCGRVVCNDCSPHRITIPRQFIVNPPGSEEALSPIRSNNTRNVETIDLTGDDDDEDEEDEVFGQSASRRNHSSVISMLEGGEKVRLCNPCVPDPQPEPPPNYPYIDSNNPRSVIGNETIPQQFGPPRNISMPTEISGQLLERSSLGIFPRSNNQFTASNRPPPHLTASVPRSMLWHDRFDPRLRSSPYSIYEGPESSVPRPSLPDAMLQARNSANIRSQPHMHGRYHSVGSGPAIPSLGTRPRVRSMLEANPPFSSGPRAFQQSQMPSSSSGAAGSSRPRLHETDICPVCRRALPPRGENGDETAREAHIMACINARDPSIQGSGQQSASTPGMVYLLPFVATEKDCLGEDGNVQECSICMVEYDVGEELARLECLCKFHKECIRQWLVRKQECPVHKLSHVGMSS